ncbi:sex comb on midleg-like protein 4 isoform X2 [Cololabis saira]|uniref:sex comb on midleg-like protein 4 isoform X2 n=1 Tax=Cololabis saira TaxID=129043 RepID=UPI002AD31E32|nr:sex comb on midleg-like protein 4 isoform X2 [Cololabis saira]
MRLRGGRDFSADSRLEAAYPRLPVPWLPLGVLREGVRLRLRLDHHDHRGRGYWQLVALEAGAGPGAGPEPVRGRPRNQDPETCTPSLMSNSPTRSEMQTSTLDPEYLAGPQAKVPGRKRGRPPVRKLEGIHSHYAEHQSPIKIPKKRGRKPGFKLKPRTVMSSLTNSYPSGTPEPEMGSVPQDAAIVPHSATPQILAETPLPDDCMCDPPVDSKRYAVDPSDSAFNIMASQYQSKHSYGYRSSSCAVPQRVYRRASSPATFQDGNRNDYGESKRFAGKDPSSWGVEDVVCFIKGADPQALGPHAETFRKHEIDGDALLLLKSDMMMKYLGLKLGPALKLCYHIERLKQNQM